ncbi:acyl carrier protein [Pseudomonas sp. RIT-PI-AD]|uniref:acyl carrier protein n=1 Tax=Pseudomonas sp. RIT-PI-AD TaxID=3035294 RepID=UPI0021D8D71C|nr:acyl carrier protein [Pseudomonas sp. RIT-PI-AD]
MNNPLDLDSVIASTREILAQLLVIDVDDIEANSSIVEDLSADSLDIVDLSFQLGRQYGCTLPKTTVLDHAAAVCGDIHEFVNESGLTENGKALLEGSLSAYAPDQLRVGMKPGDVFAVTTVRNWAEQCRNVFNYLPATCPECAGHQAVLNERQQVVCASCSARLTPADGDEISRRLVETFVSAHLEENA